MKHMATTPATKKERHFENEGGQLARKYVRAAVGRLLERGDINRKAADLIVYEVGLTVGRSAKRAGGLGRK